MGDALPGTDAVSGQPSGRTRAFRLAIAVLLLLPLPSLAGTLTIGTWNFFLFAPTGWSTNGSVGNNLTIQGGSGTANFGDTTFYVYAPITYGTPAATQISAVTSNFNALKITAGAGVNITMLFSTTFPFATSDIYGPNMFSGTLPSSLGPITNKPIPAGQAYIAIEFDFISGTSWTSTPSSPFQVTFSEL